MVWQVPLRVKLVVSSAWPGVVGVTVMSLGVAGGADRDLAEVEVGAINAQDLGAFTVEDEKNFRDAVEKVIEEHGTIRLLADIGDVELGRVDPKAAWTDLKAAGFFTYVEKLAVEPPPT